ncbi:MAG: hypothetical protein LQ352_002663 [Teloschistes flavicans]|nr:MAG: hypothetical protein LQ352_002663 [Teloschistes flavicans]
MPNRSEASCVAVLLRLISTNSAIRKGLRKAQRGRSRLDPPTRLGGRTWRSRDEKDVGASRLPSQSLHRAPRFLKDNDAPGTLARGSLSRQRRTPGRIRDSNPERQYQPPPKGYEAIQRGRPSSSRSQDWVRPSPTKAATLNRAERRAARFGHHKNPPEDYKALPVTKFDQSWSKSRQESHHSVSFHRPSSRDRPSVHNRFATKHSEGEAQEPARPTREQRMRDTKEDFSQDSDERPRRKSTAPIAIPYTTPASEFLYGHSVVTSALQFSHRKFYKLYLYDGDSAESRGQDKQVRKLALATNLEVTRVGNDWVRLMDKMSGGRPHNGYVLEASRLPSLPLTGLRSAPVPQSSFEVILDHQSREDEAVNGTKTTVLYGLGRRRFPFLMLLDGIRDPGNVGGIIRSAKFLGADGILLCIGHTAPLTPVALKAAAGAAETLPLFTVSNTSDFIDISRENGWKFYAAVSPNSSDSGKATGRSYFSTATLGAAAEQHPCVLMLGSEGDGLRWNIQKKADYLVGIEAARTGYGEMDSLNVSVAAGLLCDAFLKRAPVTSGRGANKRVLEQTPTASHNEPGFDLGFADPGTGKESSGRQVSGQRLF